MFSVVRCSIRRASSVCATRHFASAAAPSLAGEALDQNVSKWEHRDSLLAPHQKNRWTFLELQDHTNAVATGLIGGRVSKGDAIVAALNNDAELVTTVLAAAKLGASVLSVPPKLSNSTLDSYLSRSNARALIFTPLIGDHNNWPVVEGTLPELGTKFGSPLRSVKYPRLKTIVHTSLELHDNDTHMFHSILVYDPLPSPLPKIARSLDGSLPLLQYLDESGSKIQTITQAQYIERADAFARKAKLTIDDRLFVASPLTAPAAHAALFGSVLSGSTAIIAGATDTSAAQLDVLLRHMSTEFTTVLHATPQQLDALVNHPRLASYNLSSLKQVIVAGATVSTSTESQVAKVLKVPIVSA